MPFLLSCWLGQNQDGAIPCCTLLSSLAVCKVENEGFVQPIRQFEVKRLENPAQLGEGAFLPAFHL